MATDDDSTQAMIERVLARDPHPIVDTSIELLELVANALIERTGEQGFEILLFRTIQRVNIDFPWLLFDPRSRPADPEFNALRRCFEAPDRAEAGAASALMFNTLTEGLTLLIGKHLTISTLHTALGRVKTQEK